MKCQRLQPYPALTQQFIYTFLCMKSESTKANVLHFLTHLMLVSHKERVWPEMLMLQAEEVLCNNYNKQNWIKEKNIRELRQAKVKSRESVQNMQTNPKGFRHKNTTKPWTKYIGNSNNELTKYTMKQVEGKLYKDQVKSIGTRPKDKRQEVRQDTGGLQNKTWLL